MVVLMVPVLDTVFDCIGGGFQVRRGAAYRELRYHSVDRIVTTS